MADNITAPAAGSVLATNDIGGIHYPRSKVTFGVEGVSVDVSASNPLPVTIADPALPDGAATEATSANIVSAVTALATALETVDLGAATLAALETIELGTTTLAALENITATVTGVATAANQTAEIAAIATIGTRAYSAGQQVAIGAASAASTGLAATEVLLHASSRCFVRVATAATAGAGIPLEAGEKFHLRLNSGQQIHVIRDTADGFLNVVPVV